MSKLILPRQPEPVLPPAPKISKKQIEDLHSVIKSFVSDRIMISAAPGYIRNSGKWIFAVNLVVGDNETHKIYNFMYREAAGNFKDWLQKTLDELKNK